MPSEQPTPEPLFVMRNVCEFSSQAPALRQGPRPIGGTGTLVWRQPLVSPFAGSQTSLPVHHFPSSQAASFGVCEATPLVHLSLVQDFPSLGTSASLLAWVQPEAGEQLSSVQGLPSSQDFVEPP